MSAPNGDRVFAVEDDLDTQSNLRDILSLDGYQLEVVSTIGAAIRRQDLNQFFAFVLDRQLPDGSADDLLPHIRKAAPSAGILIVTGHADLSSTITALRHGVDDYILKPIDADRPPRYTVTTYGAVQVPEPEMVTPPPTLVERMVQVPLRTLPLAVGTPVPEKMIVTGTWFSRKLARPVMLPSSPAVPLPNPETSLMNTVTLPPKI